MTLSGRDSETLSEPRALASGLAFGEKLQKDFFPPLCFRRVLGALELWEDSYEVLQFNTTAAALLLILSAPLLAGFNFSPAGVAPKVTVDGTSRTVYSFTNTAIVVEVPSTLAAGTYLAYRQQQRATIRIGTV